MQQGGGSGASETSGDPRGATRQRHACPARAWASDQSHIVRKRERRHQSGAHAGALAAGRRGAPGRRPAGAPGCSALQASKAAIECSGGHRQPCSRGPTCWRPRRRPPRLFTGAASSSDESPMSSGKSMKSAAALLWGDGEGASGLEADGWTALCPGRQRSPDTRQESTAAGGDGSARGSQLQLCARGGVVGPARQRLTRLSAAQPSPLRPSQLAQPT